MNKHNSITFSVLITCFLLLIFCNQSQMQYQGINDIAVERQWLRDLQKNKKGCNKYLGSKKNTKDRKIALSVVDSLLAKEKISHVEFFNWISHKAAYDPYKWERISSFYISINNANFYEIMINIGNKKCDASVISKTDYLSAIREVKEYKRELEYSHFKYNIYNVDGGLRLNLLDSLVYCSLIEKYLE